MLLRKDLSVSTVGRFIFPRGAHQSSVVLHVVLKHIGGLRNLILSNTLNFNLSPIFELP